MKQSRPVLLISSVLIFLISEYVCSTAKKILDLDENEQNLGISFVLFLNPLKIEQSKVFNSSISMDSSIGQCCTKLVAAVQVVQKVRYGFYILHSTFSFHVNFSGEDHSSQF